MLSGVRLATEGSMLDCAPFPPPTLEAPLPRRYRRLIEIIGVLGLFALSACSGVVIGPPPDNCQYKCGH
jgi:hypothetical protein